MRSVWGRGGEGREGGGRGFKQMSIISKTSLITKGHENRRDTINMCKSKGGKSSWDADERQLKLEQVKCERGQLKQRARGPTSAGMQLWRPEVCEIFTASPVSHLPSNRVAFFTSTSNPFHLGHR